MLLMKFPLKKNGKNFCYKFFNFVGAFYTILFLEILLLLLKHYFLYIKSLIIINYKKKQTIKFNLRLTNKFSQNNKK